MPDQQEKAKWPKPTKSSRIPIPMIKNARKTHRVAQNLENKPEKHLPKVSPDNKKAQISQNGAHPLGLFVFLALLRLIKTGTTNITFSKIADPAKIYIYGNETYAINLDDYIDMEGVMNLSMDPNDSSVVKFIHQFSSQTIGRVSPRPDLYKILANCTGEKTIGEFVVLNCGQKLVFLYATQQSKLKLVKILNLSKNCGFETGSVVDLAISRSRIYLIAEASGNSSKLILSEFSLAGVYSNPDGPWECVSHIWFDRDLIYKGFEGKLILETSTVLLESNQQMSYLDPEAPQNYFWGVGRHPEVRAEDSDTIDIIMIIPDKKEMDAKGLKSTRLLYSYRGSSQLKTFDFATQSNFLIQKIFAFDVMTDKPYYACFVLLGPEMISLEPNGPDSQHHEIQSKYTVVQQCRFSQLNNSLDCEETRRMPINPHNAQFQFVKTEKFFSYSIMPVKYKTVVTQIRIYWLFYNASLSRKRIYDIYHGGFNYQNRSYGQCEVLGYKYTETSRFMRFRVQYQFTRNTNHSSSRISGQNGKKICQKMSKSGFLRRLKSGQNLMLQSPRASNRLKNGQQMTTEVVKFERMIYTDKVLDISKDQLIFAKENFYTSPGLFMYTVIPMYGTYCSVGTGHSFLSVNASDLAKKSDITLKMQNQVINITGDAVKESFPLTLHLNVVDPKKIIRDCDINILDLCYFEKTWFEYRIPPNNYIGSNLGIKKSYTPNSTEAIKVKLLATKVRQVVLLLLDQAGNVWNELNGPEDDPFAPIDGQFGRSSRVTKVDYFDGMLVVEYLPKPSEPMSQKIKKMTVFGKCKKTLEDVTKNETVSEYIVLTCVKWFDFVLQSRQSTSQAGIVIRPQFAAIFVKNAISSAPNNAKPKKNGSVVHEVQILSFDQKSAKLTTLSTGVRISGDQLAERLQFEVIDTIGTKILVFSLQDFEVGKGVAKKVVYYQFDPDNAPGKVKVDYLDFMDFEEFERSFCPEKILDNLINSQSLILFNYCAPEAKSKNRVERVAQMSVNTRKTTKRGRREVEDPLVLPKNGKIKNSQKELNAEFGSSVGLRDEQPSPTETPEETPKIIFYDLNSQKISKASVINFLRYPSLEPAHDVCYLKSTVFVLQVEIIPTKDILKTKEKIVLEAFDGTMPSIEKQTFPELLELFQNHSFVSSYCFNKLDIYVLVLKSQMDLSQLNLAVLTDNRISPRRLIKTVNLEISSENFEIKISKLDKDHILVIVNYPNSNFATQFRIVDIKLNSYRVFGNSYGQVKTEMLVFNEHDNLTQGVEIEFRKLPEWGDNKRIHDFFDLDTNIDLSSLMYLHAPIYDLEVLAPELEGKKGKKRPQAAALTIHPPVALNSTILASPVASQPFTQSSVSKDWIVGFMIDYSPDFRTRLVYFKNSGEGSRAARNLTTRTDECSDVSSAVNSFDQILVGMICRHKYKMVVRLLLLDGTVAEGALLGFRQIDNWVPSKLHVFNGATDLEFILVIKDDLEENLNLLKLDIQYQKMNGTSTQKVYSLSVDYIGAIQQVNHFAALSLQESIILIFKQTPDPENIHACKVLKSTAQLVKSDVDNSWVTYHFKNRRQMEITKFWCGSINRRSFSCLLDYSDSKMILVKARYLNQKYEWVLESKVVEYYKTESYHLRRVLFLNGYLAIDFEKFEVGSTGFYSFLSLYKTDPVNIDGRDNDSNELPFDPTLNQTYSQFQIYSLNVSGCRKTPEGGTLSFSGQTPDWNILDRENNLILIPCQKESWEKSNDNILMQIFKISPIYFNLTSNDTSLLTTQQVRVKIRNPYHAVNLTLWEFLLFDEVYSLGNKRAIHSYFRFFGLLGVLAVAVSIAARVDYERRNKMIKEMAKQVNRATYKRGLSVRRSRGNIKKRAKRVLTFSRLFGKGRSEPNITEELGAISEVGFATIEYKSRGSQSMFHLSRGGTSKFSCRTESNMSECLVEKGKPWEQLNTTTTATEGSGSEKTEAHVLDSAFSFGDRNNGMRIVENLLEAEKVEEGRRRSRRGSRRGSGSSRGVRGTFTELDRLDVFGVGTREADDSTLIEDSGVLADESSMAYKVDEAGEESGMDL